MNINLYESLDKIYPLQRIETKMHYVLDEFHFEIGSKTFVVRSNKVASKDYGKKVNIITFGVKKGVKNIGTNLDGISNIRQYLATVFAAIEKMNEDPTSKLENKSDGYILSIPNELFEKYGDVLKVIAKRKFKKIFKTHNSYFELPTMEDRKALYIWKKEKSFDVVFSNLPVSDDSDDKIEPLYKGDNLSDAPNSVSTETDDSVFVAPIEPESDLSQDTETIPTPQKELRVRREKTFTEIKMEAMEQGGIDLNNHKFNLRSYYKLALAPMFFKYEYGRIDYVLDKNSNLKNEELDVLSEDIYSVLRREFLEDKTTKIKLPSETAILIALNLSGVQTGEYDDFYRDAIPHGVSEADIARVKNKLPKRRESVTFDTVIDICMNAENILSQHGIDISKLEKNKSDGIKPKLTITALIDRFVKDKTAKEQIFNSIIASVNPVEVDTFDPFEYSESSKGSKKIREMKYEVGNQFPTLNMLMRTVRSPDDFFGNDISAELYLKYMEKLPSFMHGMYSEDKDVFETSFIFSWTLSGSSSAQRIVKETFSDYSVNAELNDFYVDEGNQYQQRQIELENSIAESRKNVIQENLSSLYEKSQEFFKKKFGKKYDTKKIKLYRGVGVGLVDNYIPGALESWTTQISTANRFADMMGHKKGGTILTAEVPIQDIFGSFESLSESFPGEEDLKGKKEYIVMGGTFATTPIYIFDVKRKETKNQLKPFKEWLEENKKMSMGKSIKIVTPSMKDFQKVIASGKSAFGNTHKENELRKPDDSEKSE